tara:strand:- start:64 stop:543 length:480 start_codon:yes stop_codon:yes gene_type:complete
MGFVENNLSEKLMKKVLLGLVIAIMIIESVFACKTPEELMDNYFNDFNTQDIKMVERNFSFPLMVIQNGNKTVHNDISTFLNFKKIKKTGWKESVINSLKLLMEKDKSAITQLNFSRINNDGNVYLTSDVNYILIKENEYWYISSIIIDSDITLGIENN